MKAKLIRFKGARRVLSIAVSATLVAAAGCKVGPNYKAPLTAMPPEYREATTAPTTAPTSAPVLVVSAETPADIRWWRHLDDPQLTDLVEKAVKANYGVAVAEARLREARAARQVAKS